MMRVRSGLVALGLVGYGGTGLIAGCFGDDPAAFRANDAGEPPLSSRESSDGSVTDGGTSDDGAPTADANRACDLDGAWLAPTPVTEVNSNDYESLARISPAGDELFVSRASAEGAASHVVRFTKAANGGWENARVEVALHTSLDGGVGSGSGIALTAAGLDAVLQYQVNNQRLIRSTTRTVVGGSWSRPSPISGLPTPVTEDEAPWVNADGSRLYYSGLHGPNYLVFQATRSGATYSSASLGFDMNQAPRNPVLTADELTIYFVQLGTPPGTVQSGAYIYRAHRANLSAPFGTPEFVPTLNDFGSVTRPSWLSADGCTMLLHRDGDIYIAKRPP